MKYLAILLVVVSAAVAQRVVPKCSPDNCPLPTVPFSFNASAVTLPGGHGTFMGTDAGVSVTLNEYVSLSEHNIISSDGRLAYFGGGIDYFFPVLSLKINNADPNLSGFRLLFSIGGSFGTSHVTLPSNATTDHYSEEFHGAVSYALTSKGTWQLGLRAGAARFPYYTKGWTPVVELGPSWHF